MSQEVAVAVLICSVIVLLAVVGIFAWVIKLLDKDKRKWVAKYVELANAVDAARQEQMANAIKAANARRTPASEYEDPRFVSARKLDD